MVKEAPDPDLTEEQKKLVAELSDEQLQEIDEMLISFACKYNRKVARVVGSTMSHLPNRVYGIPDVFYAQRVKLLVKQGRLISEGNLQYMCYSEVRLPKYDSK